MTACSGGPWGIQGVSSTESTRRLADLDQVAVGVADIGTDLDSVILRLRKERGPLGRPLCVSLLDVRDSHVEKRTRLIRFLRSCQGDFWLVVRWPTANIHDQPRVSNFQDHGIALADDAPAEQRPIELP